MRPDTYSPGGCRAENSQTCGSLHSFRLYARRQPLALLAEQLEVLAMCEPLGKQTRAAVYGCAEQIAPQALRELSAKEFGEVLRGPMSTRWPSLGHMASRSAPAMIKMRDHLAAALDESRPIEERAARLWPGSGQPLNTSLSTNTVTPFLHVTAPARYPVWSSEVQQGLAMLGLWPQPAAIGGKAGGYAALSDTCRHIAAELRTDLWTLETLVRRVAHFDRLGYYVADVW